MHREKFFEAFMRKRVGHSLFHLGAQVVVLGVLCCWLSGTQLFAQANVGGIVGNVSDSSGAAISGAAVMLTNPATNEEQKTQTNSSGEYVFTLVRPATYNISAEFKGFKRVVRENVDLQVAEKIRVDFILLPGTVTQTVEVRAASPLLQPETSSIGSVIAESTILGLPLEGRNVYELVKLVPGVTPAFDYGGGENSRVTASFAGAGGPGVGLNEISINGGRNLTNEFLLDDVPNTAMGYNGVAVIPPVDAVQEFNVLTNSMSARYGRTGGGLITAVTKSGTNSLHGTGWDFLRNSALDANNFFSNESGAKVQALKQNQFGGTVGGPIVRNKTFFFGSYEGFRQETGGQLLLTVPTDLQKQGDFSQTYTSSPTTGNLVPVQIYNPFTTRPNGSGGFVRDQFPGNVIPSSMFDPIAVKLMQYFPEPNLPGDPLTHANNFESQAGSTQLQDSFMVRIDHDISQSQRFFGRFSWDRQHLNPANVLGNIADFNDNPFLNRHRGLALSWTDSLSPTTVLNVRYGLVREGQNYNSGSLGFDPTKLGFPASLTSQYEALMFPRFDIAGFTSLGTQFFTQTDRANTTQSLAANLSKVIGRNSLEVGADLRLIQGALFQAGWPSGQFQFDAGFTNGPDPTIGENNGSGLASMLLGTTSNGNNYASYDPHWFFTNRYYAFYVQDDIKVSRKLTLNVGLRYDYESPLSDRHDQLSFLNFSSPIPISVTPVDASQGLNPALAQSLGIGLRPNLPLIGGGAGFPGVNGIGKGVSLPVYNNFGPRLGLAYAISSKTVVRTAYGIIYPGTTADNSDNFPTIQGFNPITNGVLAPNGITPQSLPDRGFLLSNPFPNGLRQVQGSSQGLLTSIGSGDTGFLRNDKHAYYQQWNFGVQRELPGSMLVEAVYVGAHSVHLQDYSGDSFDALPDKYLALGNSLFDSLPNPFYGVAPANTALGGSSTISREQLLLPFPEFTTVNGQAAHRTSSTYNGLELKVQKRATRGLSVLGSYTFSKTLDDDSATDGAVVNITPFVTGHQDLNNLKADHSLSANDRSQVLNISSIYDLPFGRGKAFGAGIANPVMSHIMSGWETSSILTFGTGFPIGMFCGYCSFPANRPDLVGNPNSGSGSVESRLNDWLPAAAFAPNLPFQFGNVSRTLPHTRGPGQANTDFSLIKDTRFGERYSVQFRAEFFNFLNRPQFGQPNSTAGSPNLGQITTQVNQPRQIQFGLKFYW